jgi:acyl carrier protein
MNTRNITFHELRRVTEEVIHFVEDSMGVDNVTISSELERGLGITGDDASELIIAFENKYKLQRF